MKVAFRAAICVLALSLMTVSPALSAKTTSRVSGDDDDGRPISKIVDMLKGMAEQSKTDGEAEAETFGAFECYATKTIKEKTTAIADLQDLIDSTTNRIEKLTALSSELSSKKVQLGKDLESNNLTQVEANGTRTNSNAAFQKEEADMSAGLQQLSQAYDALAAISGESASSDNASEAALLATSSNPSLMAVTKQLQEVTKASQDFLAPQAKVVSMLGMKAPGDYEQQSGGVLAVLESTRDSYIKNLQELRETEDADVKAHAKLVANLLKESEELNTMLDMTESEIASTTEEIGTRREALKQAETDLASETSIKEQTETTLKDKTKIYEDRKLLRSQEDAAIAKAVSVLNSDAAFESFGKTQSTALVQAGGESFLQLSAAQSAALLSNAQRRSKVLSFLRQSARQERSARLAHLAALVASEEPQNPFKKVLDEIEAMQGVIGKEAKADKKKFDWCASERSKNNDAKKQKETEIDSLNTDITNLDDTINSPADGLAVTLSTAQADLTSNQEDQTTETSARKKENQEYQQSIADLQVAQNLIKKAMKVLETYYAKISFVQVKSSTQTKEQTKEDPAEASDDAEEAPTYDAGAFSGQSSAGGNVISLMEGVLSDTAEEEEAAHKAEQEAQASFEDSMKLLTDSEAELRQTILDTTKEIADKRLELDEKKDLLGDTQKEKASIEKYLAEIKPGCDFIATNFDQREANRQAESKSLADAIDIIKGTPAYQNFQEEQASKR